MELEDPKTRRTFVKYILSLQDPSAPLLKEDIATELVTLLTRKFMRLPNGQKTLFCISLDEAANCVQVKKEEFSRIITGRQDRPEEKKKENPRICVRS
jgi:NOL1/NOP2/fmu family ribosome biogenesis protein